MMNFKQLASFMTGGKYNGIPITKHVILRKRENLTNHFKETFKVIDLLDREKEKMYNTPSYQEQIDIYEKYLDRANNEEDYDYINNKLKELKKLQKFNKSVGILRVPKDKIDIIVNNYHLEDKEALKLQSELNKKINDVTKDINVLIEQKENLLEEWREVIKIRDTAKVVEHLVSEAKENNGLIRLTSERNGTQGITMYNVTRGNFNPYRYYTETKKVKIDE